ncbi:DUF805 domain-containing protein [Denitromonas iodatirespirans]|uniref:DUF805 domain-containing protein n=1 Tax=Denitromonas iodatirespirans TaxID=2795389 RepID=A0A944D8B0_DENI1|nr:DUF805 domain-containing protein [Denitromonas iodatirespirans]MBT0960186.1 DUF805 domain-containing protein [Denitromonas iodatirespirans]
MTDHKLVFSGDILPGHDPELVKAKLVALLKVSPAQAPRLFSGQAVTIKKGLDADAAQAYRRKLAALGVGIRVEIDRPAPAPRPAPVVAVAVATPAEPPVAASPAPSPALDLVAADDAPAGDMECPECGHRQPRRTLCLACGCDMPRVLAAREQEALEAKAGISTAQHASLRIQPGEHAVRLDAEPVRLFGADFGGRIGRRSYLAGGALLLALLLWGAIAGFRLQSLWLLGLCVLAGIFFGIRLSVLRCHDFDWRGWWVLISAIPYVGMLFSLLLTFFPGSRDDNTFGPRPDPTGWGATVGALMVLVLSTGLAFKFFAEDLAGAAMRYGSPAAFGSDGPAGSAAQLAALSAYDPARDRIVMYSLTTCGYCDLKRAEFDALGVRYREVFIDTDTAAGDAMWAKLRASGWNGGGVGTPTLEVNGVMLPNNPSLERMSQHFVGQRRRAG